MELSKYLTKSMSYEDYWGFFEQLVKDGKTNWHEQTEEMINYTKLNFQRSRRIHKQFKLTEEVEKVLKDLKSPLTWLAITEPWCGDASQSLPVFHEISKRSDFINFRLVLRDTYPELIDEFLTNGSKSIPKLIQIDEEFNVINTWGPRPEPVQIKAMEFKTNPWTEKQKFYEEIQSWYNNDKGVTLQNEILPMIKKTVDA